MSRILPDASVAWSAGGRAHLTVGAPPLAS
jgi:hypothetical protein